MILIHLRWTLARLKHSAGVVVGNISNITEIPSMDNAIA
jgi:hypothetical protein